MLNDAGVMPAVSVLICSRDRRDMLDALLSDLRAQNYADFEIVVVEETDAPRAPEGVRYVPHPVADKGIAFARNLAVQHAKHALLVFIDDDCRVEPDWLSQLVAPFADTSVLGVQGGVTVPEGTNTIGWAESLLGFPGGGISRIRAAAGTVQPTTEISTLNAAYRREAVEQAGGFNDVARYGGEDFLLAREVAKQGELRFMPDALVRHAARGNFIAIWRWFVRRGRAEVGILRAGLAPAGFGGYLLRASLSLKLVGLLLLCPWLGLWPLMLFAGVYAVLPLWRFHWALSDAQIPVSAVWVAPFVKGCMDLAADHGRLLAWISSR